jgi:signal transduction histidine kinase
VVLDASGLVVDTNPAGRRLATNGLADGPSGVSFRAAFSEWPELVQLLGDRDDGQADLLHPATQQTFAVQVAPIREPGVEGCRLVTLRDVTERIRIEADLRQARDLAESASNAKSAFLATISHELRTPLTVIMGYSEMLLEEARAAEQDETALRLERIKTSGQHLLDLVNDVLDLSRMEAGRLLLDCHWFDVRDLLQQAEALGRPLAEQNGNTLEVVCEEPLGQMFSDMTRVRQVLINLLSNAARFTQRGSIRLQVKRYVETDGCDWLSFSVTDSGIGMSGDQMSGLFQPFSQVESPITRRQGGAGLGLAISRRLCQMLGGDISVRSQAGKGSTFTVLLPASTPQS